MENYGLDKKVHKDDMKLKRETINNILKERLYNSFAQAILKIFVTPYPILKVFLFVIVIGTTGLASYLVIRSLMDYLNYGVTTTSRTIYETPTLFPKVTFCNLNLYTTEYAFNLTQKGILFGNNLSNEEKKKVGHDLDDILIECQFSYHSCNSSDFIWSYDLSYGNCFTFNMDTRRDKTNLKKSTSSDPWSGGLILTLYIDVYEELLNLNERILNTVMVGRGAIIQIGNSSYSKFHTNNGILLSAGSVTFLAVDREFKSVLPKPYSECEINSKSPKFKSGYEFYNLIAQNNYDYTQQLCLTQCMQKQFIDEYNCTYPYFPTFYNVSACNGTLYNIILTWNNISNSDFMNRVCLPVCPLECDQIVYKSSISSSQLIGNYFDSKIKTNPNLASDFINRTIDAATARESFVRVYIFYDSLSYTQTTESPQYDIVSLMGSIGGNMGLFLGISVFSICEIGEVIIEIAYIKHGSNRVM